MLHFCRLIQQLFPPWIVALAALMLAGTISAATRDESVYPPIRIGVSLGLTGSCAEIGKLQEKAYRLWERDINTRGGILGRAVEIIVRNDQSDPEVAKGIYEDFIQKEKLDFVFGPYSSPITAAVAPIVDKHGYPTIAAG
jgi:branched-chain amino acid transport system substrate-binding protein